MKFENPFRSKASSKEQAAKIAALTAAAALGAAGEHALDHIPQGNTSAPTPAVAMPHESTMQQKVPGVEKDKDGNIIIQETQDGEARGVDSNSIPPLPEGAFDDAKP